MGGTACASCASTIPARARFCPACGMATGAVDIEMLEAGGPGELTTSTRTVEASPSRRGLVLGGVAILVLAGLLAFTRGDGDPAVAAAPEPFTPTTLGPEPTTTTMPFEPPPDTPTDTEETAVDEPGALEPVDVSQVPDALRTASIVLPGDPALAIDLGTGAVTELGGRELDRVEEVIESTERGVVVRDENGSGKLVDWGLRSSIGLGWNIWPGSSVVTEDAIWVLDADGDRNLVRIDEQGRRTDVLELPSWISLVGGADGAAYVSAFASGSVVRVTDDGDLRRVAEGIGVMGGEEWLLLLGCDDQLTCAIELVDLRTGRRLETDLDPDSGFELVRRSTDGRRALVREWADGSLVLLDADDLSAQRIDPINGERLATDADVRFVFGPASAAADIQIVELATGALGRLTLPRAPTSIIVTPDGWVPDERIVEAASSTR
ncbi:MAG: hypothetical protein AAGA17_09010 [Actinomycetota bacterium]